MDALISGEVPDSVKKLTQVELNCIKPAVALLNFIVRRGGMSSIRLVSKLVHLLALEFITKERIP